MCLILIGYQESDDYPLVVVANRDEYFARSTSPVHFWNDAPDVFAGRDQEQGGTWMGVNRNGRFAAVTNWTDSTPELNADLSRGKLVADFLKYQEAAKDYVGSIEGNRYQGFNLVLYDGTELWYYSNCTNERRQIEPGVYGLSNTKLGDQWLRVVHGERKLAQQIGDPHPELLIEMLYDPQGAGFKAAPERQDAPCFILGQHYGTRSTTALVMSKTHTLVREQTYGPMGSKGSVVENEFAIECAQVSAI